MEMDGHWHGYVDTEMGHLDRFGHGSASGEALRWGDGSGTSSGWLWLSLPPEGFGDGYADGNRFGPSDGYGSGTSSGSQFGSIGGCGKGRAPGKDMDGERE